MFRHFYSTKYKKISPSAHHSLSFSLCLPHTHTQKKICNTRDGVISDEGFCRLKGEERGCVKPIRKAWQTKANVCSERRRPKLKKQAESGTQTWPHFDIKKTEISQSAARHKCYIWLQCNSLEVVMDTREHTFIQQPPHTLGCINHFVGRTRRWGLRSVTHLWWEKPFKPSLIWVPSACTKCAYIHK